MANFTQINLDLQSVMKRTYANLLYRSTFYNFLNEYYIGDIRQTGTPRIELIKQKATTLNNRDYVEMKTAVSPELATYDNVIVDLTELRMDYSFRIPVLVVGSNIAGAIDEQIRINDASIAKQIDEYGYGLLFAGAGSSKVWNPATQQGYIDILNELKATLFNADVYDTYRLGLGAIEYGKLVSALTSILKFETLTGVEGVDRGEVANAYGIDIFEINDNVLKNGEKGYFASPVATVGDTFFSDMVAYNRKLSRIPRLKVYCLNQQYKQGQFNRNIVLKKSRENGKNLRGLRQYRAKPINIGRCNDYSQRGSTIK